MRLKRDFESFSPSFSASALGKGARKGERPAVRAIASAAVKKPVVRSCMRNDSSFSQSTHAFWRSERVVMREPDNGGDTAPDVDVDEEDDTTGDVDTIC